MLAAGNAAQVADLVESAWSVLEPLLALDADESAYSTAIDAGEIRTGLLFPEDPEEAGRIAKHPAIRWKVENARRHRSTAGERAQDAPDHEGKGA